MPTLFSPVHVGPVPLKHRVVMAPLTRSGAPIQGAIPNPAMVDYYSQRASDGGLIITEAAAVSVGGQGSYGAPGMFSESQFEGWRLITSAVHAKGGRIFARLWHTGRSSHVTVTGGMTPVSASVNPAYWGDPRHLTSTPDGWLQPSPHRALETREVPDVVEDYRKAAQRAKDAGFDGVELDGANGYLPDQFLQDRCNKRSDIYGGSIENRARFLLEVVDALASVFGGDRVAVRIAPAGRWNGMGDSDPAALFDYLAKQLNCFGLAYLHVLEPRVDGKVGAEQDQAALAAARMRGVYKGAIMAAGAFEPETAERIVEEGDADLVAFDRLFVSNPDLPVRIRERLPLAEYDRTSFHTAGPEGLTDYPA